MQVSDDDLSRGNADAGCQPLAIVEFDGGHRRYRCQPGAGRLDHLVLVRVGPTEVGQHAIAEIVGDIALVLADHAGHGVLVALQYGAHILGIETPRQRRRPDKIAKQHGELAAVHLL